MTQPDTLAQKSSVKAIKIESARQGFIPNVVSNVGFLGVRVLVGLWYTPYLIDNLGIGVFGIISLAESLIVYLETLTFSFNSAVTRFLTVDLNKGDIRAANKAFNTALFGLLGVIGLLIPLTVLFSFAFPYLFDVPAGYEQDATWFFWILALSFFVGVITSPFAVSSFAHSRFVMRNVINFVAMFVRVGFVVFLFSFFPPRVWQVGLAMLLAGVATMGGYFILWRRLTPELQIDRQAFDRDQMRPLMGMGGWVLVNRMGVMLLRNVDLIIVNAAFGAVATGGYGALLQITRNLRNLVTAIEHVISPVMLGKYARGDTLGLKQISIQATKLMGLCLALPIGLVCGLSYPFLSIWLGPAFAYLSPLLIALAAHLSVNLSIRPLLNVNTAYNKVRWPGIATVVAGVVNLVLAVGLAVWGGWGPLGVAVASVVAWTAKNSVYMPIYTAHIMKLPWYTFFPSLLITGLSTLAVGLGAYGLTLVHMPSGWLSLAVSATVASIVYTTIVGLVVLSRADRQLIRSLVLRRNQ